MCYTVLYYYIEIIIEYNEMTKEERAAKCKSMTATLDQIISDITITTIDNNEARFQKAAIMEAAHCNNIPYTNERKLDKSINEAEKKVEALLLKYPPQPKGILTTIATSIMAGFRTLMSGIAKMFMGKSDASKSNRASPQNHITPPQASDNLTSNRGTIPPKKDLPAGNQEKDKPPEASI
jgi:hypothetical protein